MGMDEHAPFIMGKCIFHWAIDKFGKIFKRNQIACAIFRPLFLSLPPYPVEYTVSYLKNLLAQAKEINLQILAYF